MDPIEKLDELKNKRTSRRNFIAGAGALGAATALAGCSNDGVVNTTTTVPPVVITDADILTFALNLEYLEAEFFLRAATGSGLTATDAGTGAGSVTGGAMVGGTLTPQQQQYINEIAYAEQTHVQFLRSALGAAGVTVQPRPAIDFNAGFGAIAAAANATTPGAIPAGFSPFANFDSFLIGAFSFEDVGVTAYAGAAALLNGGMQGSAYLLPAAGILAVEAYHAGEVRTLLTGRAIVAGTAAAYPFIGYANAVSAVRASLGGGNETPLVFPPSTAPTPTMQIPATQASASSIVAANATTAVGFSRTTDQVLHIVYGTGGGAGVTHGAFFPNGLNGKISATKA